MFVCKKFSNVGGTPLLSQRTTYRLHFEERNLSAIATVQKNKIGESRIFSSNFCQRVAAGNSRLKAESKVGPLFDVGVHCINEAREAPSA